MSDYLTKFKPAIDAAAEGRLRCRLCGLPVTMLDPETDRVVKVTEFRSFVRDFGEPVAECRDCAGC